MIRFTRNDNSAYDDTISGSYCGNDTFKCSFSISKHTVSVRGQITYPLWFVLTDKEVFRWVRYTLSNLVYDTSDPFKHVQIDYALMPSVMINISDIMSARESILNSIEFYLDNCKNIIQNPVVQTPVVQTLAGRGVVGRSVTMSDDDNEEEGEDVDYSDMPPLIPISQTQTITTPPRCRKHLFLDSDDETDSNKVTTDVSTTHLSVEQQRQSALQAALSTDDF